MLTAGTHTLTNFENDSLNHCILVKLTDTSAKYIQEFIKRNDVNKKTLLKFSKDKGEIIFSNLKPEDQTKSFQFGVSSIKGSSKDGTASFECVSYINKRLESVCSIEEKITIQATDEAFQATKEKVTSVAEEEKKNSAIEIKSTNNRTNTKRSNITSISKTFKRLQKSPAKIIPSIKNQISSHKINSENNGSSFNRIQTKPHLPNNYSSSSEHKTIENSSDNSKHGYSPQLKGTSENIFQTIDSLAKNFKQSPSLKHETKVDIIKPSVVEIKKAEQETKSFWDSYESMGIGDIIKSDEYKTKDKNSNEKLPENKLNTDDDWLKLKKLNSLEDRKKLKGLFDKLYPEYVDLHNYLEKENKIFSDFQEKIESMKKNSVEYQQLYERIVKEYQNKVSNVTYSSKNDRYQEFYTKLEHYYGLIKDFDESSHKMKI